MQKILLGLLGSTLIQAAAVGAAAPATPANPITVVARPLIAGLWVYQTPQMRCGEYYNFDEQGGVLIQSGAEWSQGSYSLDLPEAGDNEWPVLTFKILHENNEVDCSGQQENQSGQTQRQYVRVMDNGRRMQFCGQPNHSDSCIGLNRILP